ncbi:MAG: M20/M25/M40 family metallo-hydrolase [Planctomycetota bacterium]
MPLSAIESAVLDRVRALGPRLESRLAELVEVNSYTVNTAGVDAVARILEVWLEELGFAVQTIRDPGVGAHLVARRPGTGPRILLVGHSDTVFPPDHPVGGFRIDPEDPSRILGPGVTDMKGGNVVMLGALEALAGEGRLAGLDLTVFFSGDEEIGSPAGARHLEALAREADLALVFETGSELEGDATTFVTERKGIGRARIEVAGVESHAGARKERGLSAALSAARKIEALEALNDPARGTSVNVGLVSAGTAVNTVPGTARLEVDFRFRSRADGDAVVAAMREIAGRADVENPLTGDRSSGRFTLELRTEPMTPDARVAAVVARLTACAAELGLDLRPEYRGGASDGNVTSGAGCPTVDGLGTVGGRIHSAGEWMRRRSLVDRTALLALGLLRADRLVAGDAS